MSGENDTILKHSLFSEVSGRDWLRIKTKRKIWSHSYHCDTHAIGEELVTQTQAFTIIQLSGLQQAHQTIRFEIETHTEWRILAIIVPSDKSSTFVACSASGYVASCN